jgi:hypothetical protein
MLEPDDVWAARTARRLVETSQEPEPAVDLQAAVRTMWADLDTIGRTKGRRTQERRLSLLLAELVLAARDGRYVLPQEAAQP